MIAVQTTFKEVKCMSLLIIKNRYINIIKLILQFIHFFFIENSPQIAPNMFPQVCYIPTPQQAPRPSIQQHSPTISPFGRLNKIVCMIFVSSCWNGILSLKTFFQFNIYQAWYIPRILYSDSQCCIRHLQFTIQCKFLIKELQGKCNSIITWV